VHVAVIGECGKDVGLPFTLGCAQASLGRGRVSVGADRVERMFEDLVRLRGQLTELVTAVDPDALSGRTAREFWAEFDRVERLAAGAKTVLARRVAATHRPDRAGTKTAADDLARRGGTSTNTARDALEISGRLAELPRLDGSRVRSCARFAGVGPVPVAVARDMLGDAVLRLVVTNGVDVANVTHLGRGPTAAQRAALMWMSPTCSVEGCNRARIEIDHSEPWARTRHTRLAELNPLCGFHHGLKTRLDYALVAGSGKRPFVPPDDARHPRYRKPRGDPSHVA